MQRESAETLALQVVTWLAGNDDVLPIFLGASGAGVEDLRTRLDDPAFLLSVLDFLLMDEVWIMAFCQATDQPFDAPLKARQALPGGAEMHWT
ncbi:DUF3572 domain-containing protein [Actibacterium ureilyticum]|uniref:DUF3572 domain-containing protein n=1 Tax=Actibacterium ureilyticum TaxID=1590614 RepID=UPI000BAAAC65|nr:DUF3572 domain-containing protein [Actibacterium ureilyticum]